jgi:anti-anti-sigma factor
VHLRSRIRRVGDAIVVELDGDADLASIPQLTQALARAGEQAGAGVVVVDLDALTVLDDAALGQFVGAAAAARRRGGSLRLLAIGNRTRQRLTDTRLDQIIDVVDSVVG